METGVPKPRHRARGGSGQDAPDPEPGSRTQPHDPAAGLHDQQPAAEAVVRQPPIEGFEVGRQHRSHVGVHGGGAEAFVEPHLGQHLAGERDVQVRQAFPEPRRRRALVGVVGKGEHEAHGDAFHPHPPDLGHGLVDGLLIQRFQHRAVAVDALLDGVYPLPGNQRVRWRLLGVVKIGTHAPPHVEHVPEPGRGEQRRMCAVAGQQRVGGDGAAVDDPLGAGQQFPWGEAQLLGRKRQAGQKRARAVSGIGQGLEDETAAVAGDHQVDEGTTDVHADHVSTSGITHNYLIFCILNLLYFSDASCRPFTAPLNAK